MARPDQNRWAQAGWTAHHFASRHRTELLTGVCIAVLSATVLIPVALLTTPGLLSDAPLWLGPALSQDGARSAAAVRAEGVAQLAVALRAAAIILASLTGVALLGIGAARASRQAAANAIHRAVGASRRALRRGALVETAATAGAGVVTAGLLGAGALWYVGKAWPGTIGSVRPDWLVYALLGTPLLAVALASLLQLAGGTSRRIEAHAGPPLELHLAGGLLGIGAAAIAAALLLAPTLHRQATSAALIRHGQLTPTGSGPGSTLTDLLADASRAPVPLALASAGTELGLGAVEQHITDCGACTMAGVAMPYHYPMVVNFSVSPDTFSAINAHLVSGRLLNASDTESSEPVVVINRRMATDDFEAAGAVGRRLKLGREPERWYRVVGVVEDQAPTGFAPGQLPPARAYFPLTQRPTRWLSLIATDGVVPPIIGRGVNFSEPVSLDSLRARDRAPLAWARSILLAVGIAATLVALLTARLLVASWLRSERVAIGIQRGVGANRRRIGLVLIGRATHLAAIATVTTVVIASGFRTQLNRIAPGSGSWQIGELSLLLATLLAAVILLALSASRPLFGWSPARLLASE